MIIPKPKVLLYLLIPLSFHILAIWNSAFTIVGLILDLLLLFVLIIDALRLRNRLVYTLQFEDLRPYSIGRESNFSLALTNNSNSNLSYALRLDHAEELEQIHEPEQMSLMAKSKQELNFIFKSYKRGKFSIPTAYLRFCSPLGLVEVQKKEVLNAEVMVIPDVMEINEYLKLSRSNRTSEMGIHRNRWAGMGTDLAYLRDYSTDDDFRRIDWKASTRLNKPVTKEFELEKNNTIIFLLDCGRLLSSEKDQLSHLDYNINAILLLSYIALSHGDNIGIIAYSNKIIAEFSPQKGKHTIQKISQFLSPLEAQYTESNIYLAAQRSRRMVSKRSLVISLTDLESETHQNYLLQTNTLLKKRHLLVVFLLKNMIIEEIINKPTRYFDDLYEIAAAKDMIINRENLITKLKLQGLNLVDTIPSKISANLVEKYLEVKSRMSI